MAEVLRNEKLVRQSIRSGSGSESEVVQSCSTLCDPMDCSPAGSSVHGIFQAWILEWVAISFSRGSSRPRDRTQVSRTVDRRFAVWAKATSVTLWLERSPGGSGVWGSLRGLLRAEEAGEVAKGQGRSKAEHAWPRAWTLSSNDGAAEEF